MKQVAGAKGRGARSNPQGRFEILRRRSGARQDIEPGKPATTVTLHQARSIVSRNDSPDVPFTQSINPYQGCEHGCIYCYARPTHSFLGLSPGLDFETKLYAKASAAEQLRQELLRPGYRCEVISLGANTDPYQPIERRYRITRGILEVLREFKHPVGIATKSALVERDIDLLGPMAGERLAKVFVSISSLDSDLARRLEPRAAAPRRRLETIRRLASAGVPCGVLVAPVIPFLADKDIERVLEAARDAGAGTAAYVMLRLPYEVRDLFKDWLESHYPLKARHVMERVRDMRGGRENDPAFGSRMRGESKYAELIARRFAMTCRRLGMDGGNRYALDTTKFLRPENCQPSLF